MTPSKDLVISVDGLCKSFGTFVAVDSLSFHIRKGEVVGFLGPNGAGKSTTMRILTCFLAPTQGNVVVSGYDVFEDSLAVRRCLGYLPQRAPLYLEMSVFEYLRFAARLRQLTPNLFAKQIKNVVEVCGLAQVLDKEIRHLSHGYRQRVGLAQALIHNPPILILDEPTSDLDPNEKIEFLAYLKNIGQDRTVLLSTHNLSEVEAACSRAIIVSRGRAVADGPLADIRAKTGKVRYYLSLQRDVELDRLSKDPSQASVVELICQLAGVHAAKETSSLDVFSYEITSDRDVDLRPALFSLVMQKGWSLVELRKDAQTLEDVFRDLTSGDARSNRILSVS